MKRFDNGGSGGAGKLKPKNSLCKRSKGHRRPTAEDSTRTPHFIGKSGNGVPGNPASGADVTQAAQTWRWKSQWTVKTVHATVPSFGEAAIKSGTVFGSDQHWWIVLAKTEGFRAFVIRWRGAASLLHQRTNPGRKGRLAKVVNPKIIAGAVGYVS